MLNFAQVESGLLSTSPYPYMVVEDALLDERLADVVADFPAIRHPGSIPVAESSYGPAFAELLADLDSDRFRRIIADKFAVDLRGKPILTTVRGVMRMKDGRIHTDSKTKIITVLIYFNDNWPSADGALRILRNGENLDDYVAEIPPKLGTLLAFKVTDNCWHGHTPVEGKRLSLQMNYLTGDAVKGKHQFFHTLSAKMKKLFS
jgi:SM-20-related protein